MTASAAAQWGRDTGSAKSSASRPARRPVLTPRLPRPAHAAWQFAAVREARLDRLGALVEEHADTAALWRLLEQGPPDGMELLPQGAPGSTRPRGASVGGVTEDFRAPGVRVLITGGTSGLGAAMAKALHEAGAAVAITGRGPDRAEAVARELGPGCTGVAMDVRDEDDVERGVDRVVHALGGLDLLVNNAGLGMRTVNPRFLTDPQPFWAVPPDGFRDMVDTNLTGYFLVARNVVPRFLAAGSGRVVNISMNHSTMNRKGFVPYGPARAGAEALSRIMAADLDGTGVTVNILLPGGATATGMIPDDFPPEHRGQLLDPAIMGPPIRFLASPAAAGVHDERIVATEFENWLAARTA